MQKRTFGKTDLQVSPLGFGAAPIGYLKTDEQRVGEIVSLLLAAGVNVIDTAAAYEASEEVLGRLLAGRRKEVVLISKCGNKVADLSDPNWSPALIAKTVDRSLRRLQTDVLDVMLLHSCSIDVLKRGEAVAALAKAKQAGKIRFAGYSGDNEAAAYAATLPDISVLEMSISIADQANIDMVLPTARQNNLGVIAKRPIANAAWKDLSQQPGLYRSYAKAYTDRLAEMNLDPAALGIAGPPNEAWPELTLRFTLSQPGVHTAIIGTTNPTNARPNIAYAGMAALSPETIEQIRAAFRDAEPERGAWRGET